ncbi:MULTISPECIES: lipopolysaccharide assembly LapA domain-containing protein [unclassified Fusibacter]|uniref:LapA family protein n=1 Tax=unclassified Fusibacter TaxID=2624464 RepID=UPI0010105DB3|nr:MULTISPECIES: LapA family protein [unclassified Fusibacter]MCK8059054.1 LapA family protein [Fusibacter sp. A2]NPE22465.1 LapA family protein [Fusibacter sp. A1]RXV60569.1 LapA family protein [Fusibacter sp. A1]
MQKSFVVTLIFAVFIAIFAVMNSAMVSINLFFASFQLSQAVVILISAAIGAICMYGLSFVQVFSLKKQVKVLNKKLETAEKFSVIEKSADEVPVDSSLNVDATNKSVEGKLAEQSKES